MVQITPVKKSEQATSGLYEDKDEDYSDVADDESVLDSEDDFDPNETIVERIIALQQIIDPKYRPLISEYSGKLQEAVKFSLKAAWVVTTSVLFFAVPFGTVLQSSSEAVNQQIGLEQAQDAEKIISGASV